MKFFTVNGTDAYDIVHMAAGKDNYVITENAGVLTYAGAKNTYTVGGVEQLGFALPDESGDISFKWLTEISVLTSADVITGALWSTDTVGGSGTTYSNGNRTVVDGASSGSHGNAFALDNPVSVGKYYFEIVLDNFTDTSLYEIGYTSVGISNTSLVTTWLVNQGNASPTNTVGDVFMIAVNIDDGLMHYGKNGVWINDPAGGVGTAKFSGITGAVGPSVGFGGSAESWTYTLRTEASELQYTSPTSYSPGIGLFN